MGALRYAADHGHRPAAEIYDVYTADIGAGRHYAKYASVKYLPAD